MSNMKLKFEQPYKSIGEEIQKDLEKLDFPDFSIITGTNGSGKTHLLEAMYHKSIIESQFDVEYPMAFFNYKSLNFGADTMHREGSITDDALNALWGVVNTIFQSLGLQFTEENLLSFSRCLEYCMKSHPVDEKWNHVVSDFVNRNYDEGLFRKIQRIYKYQSINDYITEIQGTIGNFISSDQSLCIKDKNYNEIFNILKVVNGVSGFSGVGLGQKMTEIVKGYFLDKARFENDSINNSENINMQKTLADFWQEKHKEFISQKGENPIKAFNKILKVINCNGYYFDERFPLSRQEIIKLDYQTTQQNGKNVPTLETYPYQPILLNQNGMRIKIEDLSSGEQTLLGIATFIFDQQQKHNSNFILLLDEVDTNLHPSMVQKLLNLIQNIFIKEYNLKVFLVTHSPTTIALAPDNAGIFVMHRPNEADKQRIAEVSKSEALGVLTEGYATLEQGIKLLDQVAKYDVSIFSEGDNIEYLKKAKELFGGKNKNKIEIVSINDGSGENKSGKNNLKNYFDLFSRVDHKNIVFFVLDCDVRDKKDSTANTFWYIFDKNGKNDKVQVGIENLFPQKYFEGEFRDKFYKTKNKQDGGQHTDLNKKELMNYMLKNGTEEDFANFKSLFDKIDEIIDNKK